MVDIAIWHQSVQLFAASQAMMLVIGNHHTYTHIVTQQDTTTVAEA